MTLLGADVDDVAGLSSFLSMPPACSCTSGEDTLVPCGTFEVEEEAALAVPLSTPALSSCAPIVVAPLSVAAILSFTKAVSLAGTPPLRPPTSLGGKRRTIECRVDQEIWPTTVRATKASVSILHRVPMEAMGVLVAVAVVEGEPSSRIKGMAKKLCGNVVLGFTGHFPSYVSVSPCNSEKEPRLWSVHIGTSLQKGVRA